MISVLMAQDNDDDDDDDGELSGAPSLSFSLSLSLHIYISLLREPKIKNWPTICMFMTDEADAEKTDMSAATISEGLVKA